MNKVSKMLYAFMLLCISAQAYAWNLEWSDPFDDTNARWVYDAEKSVTIRQERLIPASSMLTAIKFACSKGIRVNLILYYAQGNGRALVDQTCASVFLTDNPYVKGTRASILIDNDTLVFVGNIQAVANKYTFQEYQFDNQLMDTALFVQRGQALVPY